MRGARLSGHFCYENVLTPGVYTAGRTNEA